MEGTDPRADAEAADAARVLLVRLDGLPVPPASCIGWHSAAADAYGEAVRRLDRSIQAVRAALVAAGTPS